MPSVSPAECLVRAKRKKKFANFYVSGKACILEDHFGNFIGVRFYNDSRFRTWEQANWYLFTISFLKNITKKINVAFSMLLIC